MGILPINTGSGGVQVDILGWGLVGTRGLVIYLNLNLLFGTLGHCGVEPLPRALLRVPVLNLLGTSTFHAEHHENKKYNFGFYTLIWDSLLGTLHPDYHSRYAVPAEQVPTHPTNDS